MTIEKLKTHCVPVDKTASAVIKPADPEHLWQPKPKSHDGAIESSEVLPVVPVPKSAKWMQNVIGKRRGKLTVIGYSAEQNPKKNARWVCRCDCGNYVTRTSILRWLGTQANDECRECHKRRHLKQGYVDPSPKAVRTKVVI